MVYVLRLGTDRKRMSIKYENSIKYCWECDTHFYAEPDTHEDVYHKSGEWMYITGTYKQLQDL